MDRSTDDGSITNADPKKAYVWAYKVNNAIGFYENRGYEVVELGPDSPRSNVARKKNVAPGTPVEWNDHVLMSIDKTELKADYDAGQAEVDELESRIISKGGGVDNLRGINGIRSRYDNTPILSLENLTQGTQVELE